MVRSSAPHPSAVRPVVILVDDDSALPRGALLSLTLEGFQVDAWATGEDLLACDLPDRDACLVIDERLPGLTGLDALAQLRRRNVRLPALLITSHPNQALRKAAAEAGVQIVEKPLLGDGLVGSIRAALAS